MTDEKAAIKKQVLLEEQALNEASKITLEQQDFLDELERTYWKRTLKSIVKDWRLYVLLVPILLIFLFWRYFPLYGLVGAFKANNDIRAIWQRDFVGLEWFKVIMFGEQKAQFWSAFRNTFVISFYGLLFGFPIPIILALFFNEVKSNVLRSAYQILTYLPHFVSLVVITSLISLLLKQGNSTSDPGALAQILAKLGMISEQEAQGGVMYLPQYFRSIYIISGIWEGAGYGSIVFFAAIISISPTSFEAAQIDGASKMQQLQHVVLPGIASTIVIMLILRVGGLLNVGFEKVMLLYNGYTYGTADVVTTFVSRISGVGSVGGSNQSLGSAADLLAALMSMILVIGANAVSKKTSDTTLY